MTFPFCSWQWPWATFLRRRICTATGQGGKVGRESRDRNRGVGRAGYSDGLRGSRQRLSDSNHNPHQVQSSSFKPPPSWLTGSRKHYENRHSSLWAQGEPPITLQLTVLMDAERNHVQSSMTTDGNAPETLPEYWGVGDRASLGGGQERHREEIVPEYCIK